MSRVALEKKTQGDIEQERAERREQKSLLFGALYGSNASLQQLRRNEANDSNSKRINVLTDIDFARHECILSMIGP